MSDYKVGTATGRMVSMKMTQKQAGALYMQYVKASKRVKKLEAALKKITKIAEECQLIDVHLAAKAGLEKP